MIRLSSQMGMVLLDLIDRDPTNQVDIRVANIRDAVEQQLQTPQHDLDLIDTVQRIIGDRGRVRNVLTDAKLDELRQAIFSPRELLKLSSKTGQLLCAGCGHEIVDEHVIAVVGGQFFCNVCYVPSQAACGKCRNSTGIYDSMRRLLTKVGRDCQYCATVAAQQQAPQLNPTPFLNVQADENFNWRTLGQYTARGSGARTPATPPPPPPPPSLDGIADILTGDDNDSE